MGGVVRQVVNLDTGAVYDHAQEASLACGLSAPCVWMAMRRIGLAGGYRWAYLDDQIEQLRRYEAKGFHGQGTRPPRPYRPCAPAHCATLAV